MSFSTVCGINGTFYIKSEHNLCIIKVNEYLVAKNILTNVTKTNEHSNVTTFIHTLMHSNFSWVFRHPVRLSQKGHASLWQFTRIPGTSQIIARISQKEKLPIEKSYSDE